MKVSFVLIPRRKNTSPSEMEAVPQWVCTKSYKIYKIIFTFYNLSSLDSQRPFPLSLHFSTICYPLSKWYISHWRLTASLDLDFSMKATIRIKNKNINVKWYLYSFFPVNLSFVHLIYRSQCYDIRQQRKIFSFLAHIRKIFYILIPNTILFPFTTLLSS